MSSTQFYNGRMIMDYTGKLAPTRIRIDQNQSEEASTALSNICNALSAGQQLVETGEYTDYKTVTTFPDNSAINYNVYRLTLIDNIDDSVKEYVYIPSAKLSLLTNNLDYIPSSSTIFTQIANYIQPYYRSRLNNLCTLTAIEYVNQRNTIFPSQVGTATFAPKQVKEISVTSNGQTIVNPDSGYILGRVIINTTVQPTPETEKTVSITSNGTTEIYPPDGYTLSKVIANVNVPETQTRSVAETYTANGEYNILPDAGYAFDSVLITVAVPPRPLTRFYLYPNFYLLSEFIKVDGSPTINMPRLTGESLIIIYPLPGTNQYSIYFYYFRSSSDPLAVYFSTPWYYLRVHNGNELLSILDDSTILLRLTSYASNPCLTTISNLLVTFPFSN